MTPRQIMIPVKQPTSINFLAQLYQIYQKVEQPQQDHEIPDIPFNQENFFLEPITSENEVIRTIKNFKNKSGWRDEINACSLKLAAPCI